MTTPIMILVGMHGMCARVQTAIMIAVVMHGMCARVQTAIMIAVGMHGMCARVQTRVSTAEQPLWRSQQHGATFVCYIEDTASQPVRLARCFSAGKRHTLDLAKPVEMPDLRGNTHTQSLCCCPARTHELAKPAEMPCLCCNTHSQRAQSKSQQSQQLTAEAA